MLIDRRNGWNTTGSSEDLPGNGWGECGGSAQFIGNYENSLSNPVFKSICVLLIQFDSGGPAPGKSLPFVLHQLFSISYHGGWGG